jgi:hypothetical protein
MYLNKKMITWSTELKKQVFPRFFKPNVHLTYEFFEMFLF